MGRLALRLNRLKRGPLLVCGLLALALLLAIGLRLLVWKWHEFYPLGGDEREYFDQALTLLRERRYVELRLMRPPLYGVFLAGCILFVDSLVQHLRLVQIFISAATILPMWLLTRELAQNQPTLNLTPNPIRNRHAAPLLAAFLCALNYTLARYATELLAETLFLFGLTLLFWLLVRTGRRAPSATVSALASGGVLGALCLTRSVALILLPLGALWLLLSGRYGPIAQEMRAWKKSLRAPLLFGLAALLVILPWTLGNYRTYGAVILIDTTGAENLWLDNDPAGREAVKAQLYALGEKRAERQQLAAARGTAAIREDPGRFLGKAWGELLKFVALEQTDDMRTRQAIWLPPAEVWARLLLGDGLWVVVLLAGVVGLSYRTSSRLQTVGWADPRWLLGTWSLYTLLTMLVFHVELRYRLPLYPVLLPYAALALTARVAPRRCWPCLIVPLVLIALTLLHEPYPVLAWHLAWKHMHLAWAERALERGDSSAARTAGLAALAHDPDSALARVALAQAALLDGKQAEGEQWLHEAIEVQPAHPLAHLLLGDVLRQRGDSAGARRELAYETTTLQDVQAWAWQRFRTPPPPQLDVGDGQDLGMVQGFSAAEGDKQAGGQQWRWTSDSARLRLACAPAPCSLLRLRLASGRPDQAALPLMSVQVGAVTVGQFRVAPQWREYLLPLPTTPNEESSIIVELRSETFTPRQYEPASPDGRVLGVKVDWAMGE